MAKLSELDNEIADLLSTRSEDGAFLIITVSGTEDFVQLVGDASGVQLDFPLVTGRQLSFESAFKALAQREGLDIVENSDGTSRFLDINLASDAGNVTRVTKLFLRELFRVNDQSTLEFERETDE
jgi:hypothetical protein